MRERKIQMEDVAELIEERLANGHAVTFFPSGISMLPFLKEGRDSVTLTRPPQTLKKYDLPLYRRSNGQYVLHRIVRVGDTYTCIGDNQYVFETGVRQDQLIAVVTSVYRGNREVSVDSLGYKLYCRFWHYSRSVRRVYLACKRRLRRLIK